MKKILLFILGFMAASAHAQYYIEGSLDGRFNESKQYEVTLHNPQGYGIYFEPQAMIKGSPAGSGQYSFRFRNASTTCPSGFSRGLKFYKQDSDGNWQIDSEVRNGTATYRSDRSMAIVLVLDCSNSLGDDFSKVQNSAIQFIQTIGQKTAYSGNVHIGIVAFNWRNHAIFPMPLTLANQQTLLGFISKLRTDYSTRLYSAMDEGIRLLEDYTTQNSLNLDNFDGAAMVTFTDGLDNGSQSAEKNIVNSEQYYAYLLPAIKSKLIGGRALESHVVAVMGNDVQGNETSFRQQLSSLASSPSHYYPGNMARLEQQFINIAEGLVTRWQDLFCYIPTITGNVRWVLDCNEPPAPPKPKPAGQYHEVGAVVGNLIGFSYKRIGRKHFSFQLDAGVKLRSYYEYYSSSYGSYSETYIGAALELNTNFMYQNIIKDTRACSIQWFAGGGATGGYDFENGLCCGLNSIGGIEFLFSKVPFSLQIDARPGVGLSVDYGFYFDYAIEVGLRYFFR